MVSGNNWGALYMDLYSKRFSRNVAHSWHALWLLFGKFWIDSCMQ